MKKSLLILALCAALTACASSPQPLPIAASARGSVVGFATLATFGTWEMELAPAYTRLAVLQHRAARQAEARKILRTAAVEILYLADRARALLDASRRATSAAPTAEQLQALADASRLLEQAESLLEK